MLACNHISRVSLEGSMRHVSVAIHRKGLDRLTKLKRKKVQADPKSDFVC